MCVVITSAHHAVERLPAYAYVKTLPVKVPTLGTANACIILVTRRFKCVVIA